MSSMNRQELRDQVRATLAVDQQANVAEQVAVMRDALNSIDTDSLEASDLDTDHFMSALAALATVRTVSDTLVQELADLLLHDMRVPSTALAKTIGVSHTTVQRWAK
jgi:DNA-binding XRE family transcriptional regulator